MTEDPRIVAITAWMRNALIQLSYAAVRSDHREGLAHDPLHVIFAHAVIDHTRAARFIHCQDLFNLTLNVFLATHLLCDFGDRFAVKSMIRLVTRHHRIGIVLEPAAFKTFFHVVDNTFARRFISKTFLTFLGTTSPQPSGHS